MKWGLAFNDCFGFDLYQHLRRDQLGNLDHRSHGTDVAEELSVGLAYFLPIGGNVGHVHTRADDVFQATSCFLEGCFNVADGLHGLRVGIAHAHDASIGARGGRTGHMNNVAYAHRPGITDDWLPLGSAGKVLTDHDVASINVGATD